MLRTLSESEKPNWHLHINKLMAAYNATTHSSTGYSPHYLLFGREPLLPIDVILSRRLTNAQERAHSYNNFVMEWEARMTEAYEIASKNVKKVQNYSEERWKNRLIASTLQPGDKVLVKNKREQGGPGKLRAYWEQDIYVVTKVNPDGVVYEVQKPQGGEKRMLHRNMLLSCDMIELDDDTTRTQNSQPPSQSPSVASATRSRVSRKRPVASQPAADHDSSSTDSDGTDSENEEFEAYQPTSIAQEPTETTTAPQETATNVVSQEEHTEDQVEDRVEDKQEDEQENETGGTSDQEMEDGAGDHAEEQVLPRDEVGSSTASDPGEGVTNLEVGRSEDPTTTSGLRWSDRRSRPPERLSYNELGNPVANETVQMQGTADAQVNVSAVRASQEDGNEGGWWNWFHDVVEHIGLH